MSRSAGSKVLYTSWSGSELSMLVTKSKPVGGRSGRDGREKTDRKRREREPDRKARRRRKGEKEQMKMRETRKPETNDRDKRMGAWRGQEKGTQG